MRHKGAKAQRHKEGRIKNLLIAAFFVSLCLGVVCVYSTVLSAFVNPFFACFKIHLITRPLL
jgi:hypothetical protein